MHRTREKVRRTGECEKPGIQKRLEWELKRVEKKRGRERERARGESTLAVESKQVWPAGKKRARGRQAEG